MRSLIFGGTEASLSICLQANLALFHIVVFIILTYNSLPLNLGEQISVALNIPFLPLFENQNEVIHELLTVKRNT